MRRLAVYLTPGTLRFGSAGFSTHLIRAHISSTAL
jgi:hypothetical protein